MEASEALEDPAEKRGTHIYMLFLEYNFEYWDLYSLSFKLSSILWLPWRVKSMAKWHYVTSQARSQNSMHFCLYLRKLTLKGAGCCVTVWLPWECHFVREAQTNSQRDHHVESPWDRIERGAWPPPSTAPVLYHLTSSHCLAVTPWQTTASIANPRPTQVPDI